MERGAVRLLPESSTPYLACSVTPGPFDASQTKPRARSCEVLKVHGTSPSRGARLCQYEKVRGISALPIDLSTTIARLGGGGVPSERVLENFKKDTRPGQNVSMGSLDRAGDADNTSQLCVLAEQLLFTDTAAPAIRRCRLLGLSKLCCGKSWEGEREAERPARLPGLSCGPLCVLAAQHSLHSQLRDGTLTWPPPQGERARPPTTPSWARRSR